MSDAQPRCPIEGCEYEAATWNSVKGHITKKGGDDPDDPHHGLSGPDVVNEHLGQGEGSGDGGDEGMGMPGSPEDVGDETVPPCPSCGEPLAPESELKELGRFKCSECGEPLRFT